MHHLPSIIVKQFISNQRLAPCLLRSFTTTPPQAETLEQKKARASREAIEQFQRIDQSFKLREGGRDVSPDDDIEFIEYSPRVKLILRICSLFFWGTAGWMGYNYYLVKNKRKPLEYPCAVEQLQKYSLVLEQKCHGVYNFFTKPPIKALLPAFPDIPGFQPPKTLVVTLEGTLVHSDYVLGKGMILNLRPGVMEILQKLSKKYEIVIYSNEDAQFIETCIQYLDPQRQIFSAAFGKESTVFSYHGSYIDLNYLGRALNSIIAISNDPKAVLLQPDNNIVLTPFKGNNQDKVLYQLQNLLEYLSRSEVKDVRKELAVLGKDNRVLAFNQAVIEKKQKLAESKGIGNFMSNIAKQNHSNFSVFK